MTSNTIKKLQSFVGKVCTVLTVATNKTFDDRQMADFFCGVVESIDQDGIFIRHPSTNCLTFFSWPHVVSVLEEQVVTEDHPDYITVSKQVTTPPDGFLSVDQLHDMVEKSKTMLRRD